MLLGHLKGSPGERKADKTQAEPKQCGCNATLGVEQGIEQETLRHVSTAVVYVFLSRSSVYEQTVECSFFHIPCPGHQKMGLQSMVQESTLKRRTGWKRISDTLV